MSATAEYIKQEFELTAHTTVSPANVLGLPMDPHSARTYSFDTESEARAIGKALRANLAIDRVVLTVRTSKVTERTEVV